MCYVCCVCCVCASYVYIQLPSSGLPFKLSQLRPTKNNVRPLSWMRTLRENEEKKKKSQSAVKGSSRRNESTTAAAAAAAFSSASLDVSQLQATPAYNMAVLEDVCHLSVASLLQSTLAEWPCLKDAVLLLKVQTYMHTYRHTCVHTYMHIYRHISYICIHIHTYMPKYVYTYAYVYIPYMYIHSL